MATMAINQSRNAVILTKSENDKYQKDERLPI